ncbi:hypothetical protein K491DRAFT_62361 [Lophiostoma macrostomum CBS 122681]|uniref:Uncharacterized protein n=1 Tax=Lophiostoma macrostomum CBS 122681 TaxID=1314788 RepID=A0A6A6TKH2_9PLEO|nr:hypothetical protein K491DRAFT_62361 [Lophiostoma macrostomum CBS 122681]
MEHDNMSMHDACSVHMKLVLYLMVTIDLALIPGHSLYKLLLFASVLLKSSPRFTLLSKTKLLGKLCVFQRINPEHDVVLARANLPSFCPKVR